MFALVNPTPLENPRLIAHSEDVSRNLLEVDIEAEGLEKASRLLAGNDPGFGRPAAHCYCGHQFGVFAGQLGDGATMYIGETVNSKGERWEIQFKGAGLTPFSRSADGRKVLRSSIREFLCSEHLHALGVPTTRALSICTSDSTVVRDILYDGHPRRERCAVIIRVAETFIRFGSFEIARPPDQMSGRAGPNWRKNPEIVKQLCTYVMTHFYPQVEGRVEDFLLEVATRTASLCALWQTYGWCHGVLNTDNMSILGKTLDYGPYGFMERFDPHFVCNRSDDQGRYEYEAQPSVCLWNCLKLVEALALTGNVLPYQEKEAVQAFAIRIKDAFLKEYRERYHERMLEKLGLAKSTIEDQRNKQIELIEDLFKVMNRTAADFTQLFRALSKMDAASSPQQNFSRHIRPCLGTVAELQNVLKPRYDARQIKMLVELVDQGKGDEVLNATGLSPADVRAEANRIDLYSSSSVWSEAEKSRRDEEEWVRWLGRYTEFPKVENRVATMNRVNPRFVLRNHVAQRAISKAERGDFEELNYVLRLCTRPFDDDDALYVSKTDGFRYDAPSEDIEEACAVSCSS